MPGLAGNQPNSHKCMITDAVGPQLCPQGVEGERSTRRAKAAPSKVDALAQAGLAKPELEPGVEGGHGQSDSRVDDARLDDEGCSKTTSRLHTASLAVDAADHLEIAGREAVDLAIVAERWDRTGAVESPGNSGKLMRFGEGR